MASRSPRHPSRANLSDAALGPTSAETGEMRLARFLAMAGIESRRKCEELITAGRVSVDKEPVTDLAARVDPSRQDIRLDGERISAERRVYFLVNKPKGLLCTNYDPDGRPRVVDLFPKLKERLFTVGRLDENSQGLLVVTNDGDLAQRLAHPRYRVVKTYRVQVAGIPSPLLIKDLERGFFFAEGKFKADTAKLVKVKGQSAWIEITLSEGQNREIRRLLARIGHKVLVLERVALGSLRLGTLPIGAHRPLTQDEVKSLYAMARRSDGTTPRRSARPGPRRNKPKGAGQGDSAAPQAGDAPRTPRKSAGPKRGDKGSGQSQRKGSGDRSPASAAKKMRAERPAGKRKEL